MIENLKKKEDLLFMDYIKNKNEQSFNELFELIDPVLYRLVYRTVGDSAVAKDIIQQTWLTVIEKFDTIDLKKGSFFGLIITIAKNYSLKWLKENSKKVSLNSLKSHDSLSYKNDQDKLELKDIIQKGILNLNNKNYVDVVLLFYFAELKIKEISELLKTDEQKIKVWLHRARLELKKELKNYMSESYLMEILSDFSDENSN